MKTSAPAGSISQTDPWLRHQMAIDEIAERRDRITAALQAAGVDFALVGGQAVALWVATVDPDAVRTTKDVDLLLRRNDLGPARSAARTAEMDYFETMGVGMFVDRRDPNPRNGVHLVWAGEIVRPGDVAPAPQLTDRTTLPGGHEVVTLPRLIEMKLMAWRDQDRVHLRDLIECGLVERALLTNLHPLLAERLTPLLDEQGR
jgi:hypothetical protein